MPRAKQTSPNRQSARKGALVSANGSEIELLERILGAWFIGVKTWQQTHDSIPTAFVSLARVMSEVQQKVKSQND